MLISKMQPVLCYNLSMDVFTSLGILILSALISSFLMLVPGVFANFFHYVSGKYSRQKADYLSLFFILGAESMVVLTFFFIATTIWALPLTTVNIQNPILLWIFAGIFASLCLAVICFYFKKNGQLFISRKTAKALINKPYYIKNSSDAFVLGLAASIPELPFTIPLYAFSAFIIIEINSSPITYAALIILYSLIVTLPLFITHGFFRTGHNLADILRFRHKNQSFFRFFISFLYFLLAVLIIVLGVFFHG